MIYFLLLLTTASFTLVAIARREKRRLTTELLREQRLFATLGQNIQAFARELRSITQNPQWTPAIVNIESATLAPRYVTLGITLDLLRLRGVTADTVAQAIARAILEATNHEVLVQLTPEAAAMQAQAYEPPPPERVDPPVSHETMFNYVVDLLRSNSLRTARGRRRAIKNLRLMASQVPLAADPNPRTRVVEL